jgi:hypothetical protein
VGRYVGDSFLFYLPSLLIVGIISVKGNCTKVQFFFENIGGVICNTVAFYTTLQSGSGTVQKVISKEALRGELLRLSKKVAL